MFTTRNLSLTGQNRSSKILFPLTPKSNRYIPLLSQRNLIDKINNIDHSHNNNININKNKSY